jgi:hypothetical protein
MVLTINVTMAESCQGARVDNIQLFRGHVKSDMQHLQYIRYVASTT